MGDSLADQRKLAAELGVSLGGVNYALNAVVGRDLVKARKFRKPVIKVAYLCILTSKGATEKAPLAAASLGQQLHAYEMLRCEIEDLLSEVRATD